MNHKNPLDSKEIRATIKRFEEMREEGKIPYLDTEQYEDMVEYHILNKNHPKAIEAVEMGLQIHPGNARLIAARVALFIDEEQIKEARETIDNALDNKAFPIRLVHAELFVLENKKEEAIKIIDSFQEDETDEIDCLEIGILCNDLGFFDKALDWLKKCLSFNPENEEAIATICDCYQNLGQYHKTIDLFNELIDKDPYSAEYWMGLGKSYFYLDQFDKAIEASDFALVGDEEAGDAYTTKGHAYYQLGNYPEAIQVYKEALRLGSLDIDYASMFIAFSYIGLEDWNNAYEHLNEAIIQTDESSPVYPDLLINLARCLFNLNKPEEAHSTLDFVQERFPDNELAYIYNGSYYLKEGAREKAFLHFDKAVEISPTAETWNQICVWAMNCEDYELAKCALDEIQTIDPEFEGLTQNKVFVISKLALQKSISLNRKSFKEYIRGIVSLGLECPQTFDIEKFIQQAREEGKNDDEINNMIMTLEHINDLLENYDIDQKEDEEDDDIGIEIKGKEED